MCYKYFVPTHWREQYFSRILHADGILLLKIHTRRCQQHVQLQILSVYTSKSSPYKNINIPINCAGACSTKLNFMTHVILPINKCFTRTLTTICCKCEIDFLM
mgnify:CR=1 FL=1